MAENLNEIGHHPPPPTFAFSRPVALVRSIDSDGYSVGDVAITSAGAAYEWDGDSWNLIWSSGGGSGAAQTPWEQAIDGDGFNLSDAGDISLRSTKRFSGIGAVQLYANGAALIASTPDYAGQIAVAADGLFSVAFGTTPADRVGGLVLANTPVYFKELSRGGSVGNITCGAIAAESVIAEAHRFTAVGGVFTDNVISVQNTTGGYSSIAFFGSGGPIGVGRQLAVGMAPDAGTIPYRNSAYFETSAVDITTAPPDFIFSQFQDDGSGTHNHVRIKLDGANKKSILYGWSAVADLGPIAFEVLSTGVTEFTGAITAANATIDTLIVDGTDIGSVLATRAGLGANTFTALQTITQASANAGILASTGYSLTGSNATSMIDLVGTWNTIGTPTAFKLNITNTASGAASLLMDLQVAGTSLFNVTKNGRVAATTMFNVPGLNAISGFEFSNGNVVLLNPIADVFSIFANGYQAHFGLTTIAIPATTVLGFLPGSGPGLGVDTILTRDAANTLALRNGTNAQTFNIYGTYTDASNYRRLASTMTTAGVATISAAGLGTGVAGNELNFAVNALTPWKISSAGHFLAATDNTYDIGASGATRPRNIFAANRIQAGQFIADGAGGTAVRYKSGGDGIALLHNGAEDGFTRLQFGGTTSSFGGVARDGAGLRIVTADSNTAYSFLGVSELRIGTADTGWTMTNVTPDKVLDANSSSIDEIADVLGTLIARLRVAFPGLVDA